MTTTTPNDIARFLLARIGEDEAAAQSLYRRSQEHELNCGDPKLLGMQIPGWGDWPNVQAMCARVLAECAAKKAIIEWCTEIIGDRDMSIYGQPGALADTDQPLALTLAIETLRLLAAPFSEHDDFDESWAVA